MWGHRWARRWPPPAFTVVEALIVVLVIAILLLVTLPLFLTAAKDSKRLEARGDLAALAAGLLAYHADLGRYPTGLGSLVTRPAAETMWRGPYVGARRTRDPWGKPYVYAVAGARGEAVDVFSCGQDGEPATADDVGLRDLR
jgi:general secretion pathway protein G